MLHHHLSRALSALCLLALPLVLAACDDVEDPGTNNPGGSGGQAQAGGGSGGAPSAGSGGQSSGGVAGAAAGGGGAGAGAGGAGAGGAGAAGGGAGGGGAAAGGAGGAAGGGAGGTAGGGAGGVPSYNPCPTNGDACRIMPLGDSITDGAGSSHGASYRRELFRLSLMNNKKLTFVGSHESGPDMVDNTPFPKKQEGHSGWTIDDGGGRMGLYPKIQGWLTDMPPHIVTLMIGTNDVDLQLDLANADDRLGLLLDRIITNAPNALIVLAQMVPTTDDSINQRVMTYNSAIPALVKARADAGKHIKMVDMYGAFTKNASYKTELMADTLHPKDAGYVVMANTWYDAISSYLPAK